MEATPGPLEPVLLVHWERFVGELLDRTANFPKSARFTFASRIDTLALDILDRLIRARWAHRGEKAGLLAQADADLAVLRVLLRLSFDRQFLARGPFELLVRSADEAGRMLLLGEVDREARRLGVGGWVRYMDDLFLFGPDKATVKGQADALAGFVSTHMRQAEKPSARRLGPVSTGVPALGFRVWPQRTRLDGPRRARFFRSLRGLNRAVRMGGLTEGDAGRRATAIVAWAAQGDTLGLRRALLRGARPGDR